MSKPIRLAILEDHQGIIDGYLYRLNNIADFTITGTADTYVAFELLLANQVIDVALLDVNVPTAADNPNPYPILHVIPQLIDTYPGLAILVISMLTERALIQAVMNAGASGFILKDDRAAIKQMPAIIQSVQAGGIYLSQQAHQQLSRRQSGNEAHSLTLRQQEALSLASAHPDWTRTDLAHALCVSPSTARNLLSGAYLRLQVPNLTAAIAKARQLGLITPLRTV